MLFLKSKVNKTSALAYHSIKHIARQQQGAQLQMWGDQNTDCTIAM